LKFLYQKLAIRLLDQGSPKVLFEGRIKNYTIRGLEICHCFWLCCILPNGHVFANI